MSEAKHTPGPWTVTHGPSVQIGTLYFVGTTHSEYPISDADARLIASAPDLLAALKECEPHLTDFQDDVASDDQHDPSVVAALELLRRQVRAAIAKAEGRT